MSKPLKDMLSSLCALVEMQKVYYDHCLARGFTKEQALDLTKNWVSVILNQGLSGGADR